MEGRRVMSDGGQQERHHMGKAAEHGGQLRPCSSGCAMEEGWVGTL